MALKLQASNRDAVEVNRVNGAVDKVQWGRLLDAFRAAQNEIDRKELLFRLDVRDSQFSDALGDEHKHIHLRWLVVVADMAPDGEAKRALAEQLADLFGFDLVARRTLTAEEELAELRAAVRTEFGAAGDRLVSARRGSRR